MKQVTLAALAVALSIPVSSEAGRASFYADSFQNRTTASGERFDQNRAMCAHPTLAFGTLVRIRNLRNGRSASCEVLDRGPFVPGRVIDVSRSVARRLGMISAGVVPVTIEVLK